MKALFKYILYSTFFAMSCPLVTACDEIQKQQIRMISIMSIFINQVKQNATLEYKGDGTFLKEIWPPNIFCLLSGVLNLHHKI